MYLCVELVRQKGVDVLLAVEVYQHAVNGNMDTAEIVASDLDYYPLLDALVQTRVRTVLWYDLDKTTPELIRTADQARPLNLQKWIGWSVGNLGGLHQVGTVAGHMVDHPDYRLLKEGRLDDRKVKLCKHSDTEHFTSFLEGEAQGWFSPSEFAVIDILETEPQQRVRWDK